MNVQPVEEIIIDPAPNTNRSTRLCDHFLYVQLMQDTPKEFIPKKATGQAAGYDLHSNVDIVVRKGGGHVLVRTGIKIQPPLGYYARIAPRSGLALTNNLFINGGVLDPDYRGEVLVCVVNFGQRDYLIHRGERIAQLILTRFCTPHVKIISSLDSTERDERGFGSTGKDLLHV